MFIFLNTYYVNVILGGTIMNYEKTIKRMIEQNEYIYMDTCCFMKYKQFYRFIETANKYLKLYKKKMNKLIGMVLGPVVDVSAKMM